MNPIFRGILGRFVEVRTKGGAVLTILISAYRIVAPTRSEQGDVGFAWLIMQSIPKERLS